jgi:putative transcriptional regulator
MTINHHPDDSTLLAYAAGAVNEAFSLVLAAHLEQCDRCRARVNEAEGIGGELLSDQPPVEMSAGSFATIWKRIERLEEKQPSQTAPRKPTAGIPSVLGTYISGGLDNLKWRSLVPGIKQYVLSDVDSGKGTVRLLAIAPGTTIPQHTHAGNELTLVLKGSYVDEIGRFKSGDIADLDTSVNHQPVTDTNEACICLVATDDRLRFSGVVSRVLQPLIGM